MSRAPLVVLHGGPRHGWWYFADDLAQLERSVRAVGVEPWHYLPTATVKAHPVVDTVGTVHRWLPATARGLRRTAAGASR